ncbi:glycosyltransferase family 2 protein [Micromonospora vinacea]|uniref:Glycosyltransferase involved in cell wall biosynthesis n=1 Tax=Micromonospora vinacea TaxID=709878 RepID=A0ABS0JY02_9ACTN|nr:glycosyltransferase family 2 protein [Micromonospora vinacea]MBG6100569.1 glycosyltransferase involved in cell wall biosynthesis [Micromonospora vinacea]WTA67016.1 glycosyltransferase family 2 protein [Micromonospora sp. NBC_00855]
MGGILKAKVGVPKVSVVVPAYNCGPHIEKLVASLLRQSLPADEFEAIFVDDGSTDGTAKRLDRLAAEHPHIRVLHIENSGWPSRPRNLGIEHAQGEYVFFADDDDWFADEALERLHACATTNDADIVVGKMAGYGRPVPRELFRKNRFDATLANSPLIDSLTCHKLFRRSFLNEHGLRFPEGGKRRLEDHSLVVRAYFLSRRTSVLSDYTCYHHVHRGDGRNVTAGEMDPSSYFASVREALDVVDAHTEPGPLRDRLHRRWLRNEMLSRLRGKRLLEAPEAWLDQVALETQKIIQDRFASGVAAGLPPLLRAVAYLAERGRVADLRRLANWEAGIAAHSRIDELQHTDHAVTVTVAAELRSGDQPVGFRADDGRDVLMLPMEEIAPEVLDATAQVRKARLDLVARHRETGGEIFLPMTFQTERITGGTGADIVHLVHRATATIDFAALNGGRTRGSWMLKARISNVGWTEDARLPLVFICPADGSRPRIRDERKVWNRVRSAVGRRIKR